MKFYLDEYGYPAEFDMEQDLKDLLITKNNWYILNNFYQQIKPIIEYWDSLKIYFEMKQYGEITKQEYMELKELHIREYLPDRLEKRVLVKT